MKTQGIDRGKTPTLWPLGEVSRSRRRFIDFVKGLAA